MLMISNTIIEFRKIFYDFFGIVCACIVRHPNFNFKWAYLISIFASGSEVEIAAAAREQLAAKGIKARVVSVPSFEMFNRQDDAYRASVLGTAKVNVAIEAGVRQGWDQIIGTSGIFVGMTGFGASAPYKELYKQFGITAEAVVEKVSERLR